MEIWWTFGVTLVYTRVSSVQIIVIESVTELRSKATRGLKWHTGVYPSHGRRTIQNVSKFQRSKTLQDAAVSISRGILILRYWYIWWYHPFANRTGWSPTLVISDPFSRPQHWRSAVSSMCPPRNRSRSGAEIFNPGQKQRSCLGSAQLRTVFF